MTLATPFPAFLTSEDQTNVSTVPSAFSHKESHNVTVFNNDGLLQFYFYLNGVIATVVCLIGLLGNLLNIVVLSSQVRYMKSSTNVFLLTMACADLIVLAIYLTYGLSCIVVPKQPLLNLKDVIAHQNKLAYFVFWIWYFPANIFITISNWCVVSVMIFRFLAVYIPLKAVHYCTTTRAKISVMAISIMSLLLVIPECFTVQLEIFSNGTFIFKETYLFTDPKFNSIYYGLLETLNSFLPFGICLVLAILLLRALRLHAVALERISSTGQGKARRQHDQRKISVMLIGITVWFIICTCPSFVCRILRLFVEQKSEWKQAWVKFRAISDIFLILNHTGNFILYASTNRTYRENVRSLLTCQGLPKRKQINQTIFRQPTFRESGDSKQVSTKRDNSPTNTNGPRAHCKYVSVNTEDL